jgi:hypothetical protein
MRQKIFFACHPRMNAILHPRFASATNRATRKEKKQMVETPWITTRTELLTMATHALPSSHIFEAGAASEAARKDRSMATARAPSRPSLLRRCFDAIAESQMRRAEREIDRVLGPGALERARRGEYPLRR